jgi:phospholipid transport system substrate-binding protein
MKKMISTPLRNLEWNRPDRRAVLAGLGAAALLPALPAQALTTRSAKRLVDTVVEEINRIIGSGKSEAGMINDFEALFSNYADVDFIGRYTLGPDSRSMSPAQLKRYSQAFQGYMARKYGKRFREFIGGYVSVKDARKNKSWIEVETEAKLAGTAPFEVIFSVSDKSGSEKFFNMYIEGVNVLLSERTEVQAMLDKRKGNLDRLIQDLQKAG